MNIFSKFTLRSLRVNKTRTVVTFVGIALSMALLTAVLEGAYSGIQFVIKAEEESAGPWHGAFLGLTADDFGKMQQEKKIKDVSFLGLVGWSELAVDEDDFYLVKPYLLIESLDDGHADLLSVRIVSGRLPQNPQEIILPAHFIRENPISYQIGDVLSLSVGNRYRSGEIIDAWNDNTGWGPADDSLGDTVTKTYTVVGICERMDYSVETYTCGGYMAFTYGETCDSYAGFFTMKNPGAFFDYINSPDVPPRHIGHYYLRRLYGSTD
ncbi:MAG: hypothetical protein J6Y65_01125, partial [Eggerthellaceae bacterium]|nr:hypothetical protein [Eggerthellaceae bacterium]